MKIAAAAFLFALVVQSFAQAALASDELKGIVQSRPEGKVGTWVVAGATLQVTEETKLDESEGPLVVGACAEVDISNGVVKEIESEKLSDCGM